MSALRTLPLAFFFFGSMAFAQIPDKQFSSGIFQTNCPTELSANLLRAEKIIRLVPTKDQRDMASEQRLRITLSNPESRVISAQLRVHGFPVGARVARTALYFPNDPAEITKTIVFDRVVAVGQSASQETVLRDFSTVISIDLNSVTYSDGSVWHPKSDKLCRAVGLPIRATAEPSSR